MGPDIVEVVMEVERDTQDSWAKGLRPLPVAQWQDYQSTRAVSTFPIFVASPEVRSCGY